MIALASSQTTRRTKSLRDDPLEFAALSHDSVLAIITGIVGPSYRPLGEIMSFSGEERAGSLSSGCIEADLALHARDALTKGMTVVRYGQGSPFVDLQLPCGGGLEVTLLPCGDHSVLHAIQAKRHRRLRCALQVTNDGQLRDVPFGATRKMQDGFRVAFEPEVRFVIFGSGLETAFFTNLVQSSGYQRHLFAADAETYDAATVQGGTASLLHWPAMPTDLDIDDRTAAVLFFHDHSWEPTILARLLDTPAFYIGAQGSRRAHEQRLISLQQLGVSEGVDRVKGPIGLIPSARNPQTLAVSVLAEVLAAAK